MDFIFSLIMLAFMIYGAIHASKRLSSFLRGFIASRRATASQAVLQPSKTGVDGS